MAGRGGDTTEPWYWQDDLFKLDFKESPLVVAAATSRSFWDNFTQNEGDCHALFASSPVTDSRYCNPSLFSFDIQGKGIDSQGSPSSDYGIQQNQQYKRRRMLQFSGARTDMLPPDSATPVLASGLGDCINLSIPGSENNIVPFPTSPGLLWCTRNGMHLASLQGLLQGCVHRLMIFGLCRHYIFFHCICRRCLWTCDCKCSTVGGKMDGEVL
jgi:hypothetical protein